MWEEALKGLGKRKHGDSSITGVPEDGIILHKSKNRIISMTIELSDDEKYNGGKKKKRC